MGKILEDIRMEFSSQFNQDYPTLIGVRTSSHAPSIAKADQSLAIAPTVTQPSLSLPISSNVGISIGLNDDPSNLQPTMFLGSTTSKEAPNPTPMTNEEDMDHSDHRDSRISDQTAASSD